MSSFCRALKKSSGSARLDILPKNAKSSTKARARARLGHSSSGLPMNQFWSLTKLISIVVGRLGRPPGEAIDTLQTCTEVKYEVQAFIEAYSVFICLPEVPEFSLLSVQSQFS